MGFEHSTFRLRGERSNSLRHRHGREESRRNYILTESQKNRCTLNIDEDMEVEYERADEVCDNRDMNSNYTAQN